MFYFQVLQLSGRKKEKQSMKWPGFGLISTCQLIPMVAWSPVRDVAPESNHIQIRTFCKAGMQPTMASKLISQSVQAFRYY
jgi:hypothetical protein